MRQNYVFPQTPFPRLRRAASQRVVLRAGRFYNLNYNLPMFPLEKNIDQKNRAHRQNANRQSRVFSERYHRRIGGDLLNVCGWEHLR